MFVVDFRLDVLCLRIALSIGCAPLFIPVNAIVGIASHFICVASLKSSLCHRSIYFGRKVKCIVFVIKCNRKLWNRNQKTSKSKHTHARIHTQNVMPENVTIFGENFLFTNCPVAYINMFTTCHLSSLIYHQHTNVHVRSSLSSIGAWMCSLMMSLFKHLAFPMTKSSVDWAFPVHKLQTFAWFSRASVWNRFCSKKIHSICVQ